MPIYQAIFETKHSDKTDNPETIKHFVEIEQEQVSLIYISGESINDEDLGLLSYHIPNIPLILKNINIEKAEIKTAIESNLTFDNCKIKEINFNGKESSKHREISFTNKCSINKLSLSNYYQLHIKIESNCNFDNIVLSKIKTSSFLSISDSTIKGIIEIDDSNLNYIEGKSFEGNFGISNSKIYRLTLTDFKLSRFYVSGCGISAITIGYNKESKPRFIFSNCLTNINLDFKLSINHITNMSIEFIQVKIQRNIGIDLLKGENSVVEFNQCNFLDEVNVIDTKTIKSGIKLILKDSVFRELVTFEKTQPENLEIVNTLFQNGVSIPISDNHSINIHSSVWCVLKNQALQSNDRIKALTYRKLEMDAYTRELFSEPNKCQEKTILILNKISNNHGLSWTRGLGFTLGTVLTFYSVYYLA